MMEDIDEDEVHFDQEGLLDRKKKPNKYTQWCHNMVKIICLSLAFLSLVSIMFYISDVNHLFILEPHLSKYLYSLTDSLGKYISAYFPVYVSQLVLTLEYG